jgi:SAM-dependent MidA family methyltransferase
VCDHVGAADLTAHVDFARVAALAQAAGLGVDGPVEQGAFLGALGAQARCAALQAANPARAHDVGNAVARLLAPVHMGALFKVVSLSSPGLPVPPGF